MKKIFLIDNYDSFTYNLQFYLKELGCDVTVKRNDLFEINDIKDFDAILISPGPGIPSESGKTLEVIKYYSESKNILGMDGFTIGPSILKNVFNLSSFLTGATFFIAG